MEVFNLIEALGLPIAGGLVMGYFIFLIMKQLMGQLVAEIKTVPPLEKPVVTCEFIRKGTARPLFSTTFSAI